MSRITWSTDCDAPCQHEHTDGTISCPTCGVSVDDFVAAAADWLVDNDGATANHPGYFQEGGAA